MTAEPRPGSGTPDADDGHTINVGPVTVADPGSGTPDPTPNGQTWVCVVPMSVRFRTCTEAKAHASCRTYNEEQRRPVPPAPSQRDPELAAALNEQRRQSYNAETRRTRPAPSSDTPSDERWAMSSNVGHMSDPYAEAAARPAPSTPVPEASGRGEVVQPTMHILQRADGEEMGEFAFWATDGPDGWDMAEDTDHDEDTVYEILACYPVARRKILRSTLCETCDGEGDGCPACAGSGECEPPDAEHMPIIARPAPSSSPVGDRGLDVTALPEWEALRTALEIIDGEPPWPPDVEVAARALLAAADREEPTDA